MPTIKQSNRAQLLLSGLTMHSILTDCPLGSFKVEVVRCKGENDCTSVCLVKVFQTDASGRCSVANGDLCFGCMACVAQCLFDGVRITLAEPGHCITVEELL